MDEAQQQELIRGLVAGVLSERELAINRGKTDGVTEHMKFKVMAKEKTEITDPETGNVLGKVTREKVRVQVTQVHEKFAVCRTYRSTYIPGGPFGWTSDLTRQSREIPETLRAKGSDYFPPLSEKESYVKKGDEVIELSASEEEEE